MTAGRSNTESSSHHWCTPPKYVDAIREFFDGRIELDPCSNEYSVVDAVVEYRLPHSDGLRKSWNSSSVFVNPPYGRDRERGTGIGDWLRKCRDANLSFDSEVLALVPVATNTRHWKDFVFGQATAVAFLYDTRLRFLENGRDTGKGAPMSCAMVYWGRRYSRFENRFIQFGAVTDIRNLMGKTIGATGFPASRKMGKARRDEISIY